MLCKDNPNIQTSNWKDNVNFSINDPCLFVVYPPGASGDLLISIIDKHYLRSGCEYYGINDQGRVHLYTTDYKLVNNTKDKDHLFSDKWFEELADQLARRRLNYGLLDQVIFGCHLYRVFEVQNLLSRFPRAQIINIYPQTPFERGMIKYQTMLKNQNVDQGEIVIDGLFDPQTVKHPRVLNIPYGSLFIEAEFEKTYDTIVKFLSLPSKLIRFDFVKYYLTRQSPVFLEALAKLPL